MPIDKCISLGNITQPGDSRDTMLPSKGIVETCLGSKLSATAVEQRLPAYQRHDMNVCIYCLILMHDQSLMNRGATGILPSADDRVRVIRDIGLVHQELVLVRAEQSSDGRASRDRHRPVNLRNSHRWLFTDIGITDNSITTCSSRSIYP